MRLLDRSSILLGLADIGLAPADLSMFERFLARSNGIVLVTGPTGSGKSTVINLLPRFYDPVSGRVTVDGYDVRQVRLKSPSDVSQIVGSVASRMRTRKGASRCSSAPLGPTSG